MIATTSIQAPATPPPAFDAWNESMGDVVSAIGTPRFPQTLESALRQAVSFEMMNGFVYSADGQAHDLYNDNIGPDRSTIVDHYLGGAYRLDPFYAATRCRQPPRFLAMRALVPVLFDQSDYYRRHYEKTGIVDECGFVFDLPQGAHAVLSVSQIGTKSPFDDHAVHVLKQVSPLVSAICAQHWSRARDPAKFISSAESLRRLADAKLTRRESEIVALIIKGHSTLSIASVLCLSIHTVKVHRRNIYMKLNISSEAELLRQHL